MLLPLSLPTVLLALCLTSTQASRILVIAPTYAISHFKMIQPLLKSLTQNGHQLTVLSFYPNSVPHPNYTDIDLRSVQQPYNLNFEQWSLWQDVLDLFTYGVASCDTLLASEPVQQLLRSNNKFDLVLLEGFACEAVLGFPLYYDTPYIVFSPMALPPWLAEWIWNPVESSHVPDHMCRAASSSILGRVYRAGCQTLIRFANYYYNTIPSLKLIKKHFGLKLQSLDAIKGNASAILVNSIPVMAGVRPYLPNVVEIGGIHMEPLKDLSVELSEWLDGCTAGAVVFSMGSMVQASTLPVKARDEIVGVFGRLQECVLWKWEQEIPNAPKNIKTVTWMPQSHVLAHKNVKLFISHGGFHGLYEAIYWGVPVLGWPLYGDQMTNLQMLEDEDATLTLLGFDSFKADYFEKAIKLMLDDNNYYKTNMMRLSSITRDTHRSPLETAVWWTEYVLRHRGAPHLAHKGTKLAWLEYYMIIDVAAIFFVSFLTIRLLSWYCSVTRPVIPAQP